MLDLEVHVGEFDLEELRAWAVEAGAIARQHYNRAVARRKADRSVVTEADVAIERLLVERISARYPDHGIIGEEQGRRPSHSRYVWAIDPIDGTAAFVAGLPIWGVSIGLVRDGQPHLGVFYLPLLDEHYWADGAGSAFFNGAPIAVAPAREWDSEDWLATPSNAHRRFEIDFIGKTRNIGCTVASICYVARGSAIGALLSRSSIWDLAAGLAILAGAGGVAVGLSGAPLDTAALLDGRPLPEPVVVAAPAHRDRLRQAVRVRAR